MTLDETGPVLTERIDVDPTSASDCMDARLHRVDALWERIETAYESRGIARFLRQAASAADIAEIEETLGLELPTELAYSLSRHDGTKDAKATWPTGVLLSCGQIIEMTLEERDAAAGKAINWQGGWIVLSKRPEGHLLVVDAAVTPNGHDGRILEVDLAIANDPDHPEVGVTAWAGDFLAYLEMCVADIERPHEAEARVDKPSCVSVAADARRSSRWKFWA